MKRHESIASSKEDRGSITVGTAVAAATLATLAMLSTMQTDSTPKEGSNVCAVRLGGESGMNSRSQVVEELAARDDHYKGGAEIWDGQTGVKINLNIKNPLTAQHPGDVVVATNVSEQACDSIPGAQYGAHPVIVEKPAGVIVE